MFPFPCAFAYVLQPLTLRENGKERKHNTSSYARPMKAPLPGSTWILPGNKLAENMHCKRRRKICRGSAKL